jgi:hypothetical protein
VLVGEREAHRFQVMRFDFLQDFFFQAAQAPATYAVQAAWRRRLASNSLQ